jgi:CheY-like chemotaxis protein
VFAGSGNILITDIGMPGVDGIKMLQQIRADDKLTDVEIIVISGLDGEQIQSRGGVPKGVSVFLKPVPFALIQKKIQSIANKNFMQIKS